jgi:hypothetical protein
VISGHTLNEEVFHMAKIFSRKYKRLVCGLAFVLFFGLTLQAPLMSYGMDDMDCKTKITCAACGCILNSIVSQLYLSPFFIELTSPAELQVPPALFVQEPQIHPPHKL